MMTGTVQETLSERGLKAITIGALMGTTEALPMH
jgi:hypothetical protein